jgi:hypothetical protein
MNYSKIENYAPIMKSKLKIIKAKKIQWRGLNRKFRINSWTDEAPIFYFGL